jgi:hypothetical protein
VDGCDTFLARGDKVMMKQGVDVVTIPSNVDRLGVWNPVFQNEKIAE